MDYEKLFDLVCHMCGKRTAGTNYKMAVDSKKEITLNPQQQVEVADKTIQAFLFNAAQKSPIDKEVQIQAFWGSSDLPVLTKDVFNVFNQVPNYDLFWQECFKGVALKKGQLSWEIATINSGSVFKLIPEGGKVEFEKFDGSKVSVDIQKYGMGLGVTWETIEGRKLYRFVEQMDDVRAKLYNLWADTHYGLLATAGATNAIAWQGVATQSRIDRDIQTINVGYETLGEDNKDSGYGDTANAMMLLFAAPKLKARINQALRATDRGKSATGSGVAATVGDTGIIVEYNVSPRYTFNSNIAANKALLVLPGHKIQNSVYLKELGLSKKDIETLNELRTYWTAFGAAIGDNDQVYELSFA